MLKKLTAMAVGALLLAGCDTMGQSLGAGAGVGAGVAAATGGDPVAGAIIGGAAGYACYETGKCN